MSCRTWFGISSEILKWFGFAHHPEPAEGQVQDDGSALRLFLFLLITFYFLLFTYLSLQRHRSFHSTYLDLGLEAQSVWNTNQGRFLRVSFGPNGEEISALSYHVSPIMVLLAPQYLLLAASEFFLNLFSAYNPQWQVKFHYTAAITPFIFVASIYGLALLLRLFEGLTFAAKVRPFRNFSYLYIFISNFHFSPLELRTQSLSFEPGL